ncbi:S41 family peptidase [Allosphingosinicella deserti]|uniref:Tail specific protease domain-containing protein n=1 Tax=Allosphingosinicella deserti TaxID=2116704 RepID=A0A2P7QFG1_9SPHN|nr:S41 family peptidase [Sphingomonas deserti]PSJ36666.1 hypothetical protein C7I55_25080 [Sphingomonas deserti]
MKIVAVALLCAVAGAAVAQSPLSPGAPVADAEAASPITAAEARATALDFAKTLEETYVFPEIARRYAAALREKAASGAYDGLGTAAAFAEQVTADLRAVSPDNHLRMWVGAPPPPGAGPGRRPGGPPGATGAPSPRRAPIEDAQWLAPGIAYVRLNVFPPEPEATRAAEAFMADHADAKTVIFDIRTHRGGGLDQMDVIFPYLFARPTPLVAMDTRASVDRAQGNPIPEGPTLRRVEAGEDVVRRVHSVVPHAIETRLFDAKVFVLTAGRTASAAEHFALALKRTGRATLIGEPTGGAGHYGGMRPVGTRFAAFVPVGRTFDPETGKGWEGSGVAPDVEVPAARALVTALERAGLAPADAARIAAGVKVEGSMERIRPRA